MSRTRAMLMPLREPVFRRVWLGQAINLLGDSAFVVALAGLLVKGDHPAASLSIAMAIVSTGSIIAVLIGGVLADRGRRGHLIIRSDLMRAAGTVLVIASGAGDRLPVLIVGVALMGLGAGLYQPAYQALFPTLVIEDQFQGANALRGLSNKAAGLIGASIAGVALTLGSPQTVIIANAVTYIVSIGTLLTLKESTPRIGDHADPGVLRDAREGLAYVAGRRWILAVMLQGTAQVAFVTAPLAVLLPLALSGRDGAYGWVVASQAAGAMVGSAAASRGRYASRGLLALGAASMEVLPVICAATSAPTLVVCVSSMLGGFGLAFFAVLWITALQAEVPDRVRGRVFSLDMLAAIAFAPVGSLLAGVAVTVLGVVATGWLAGGALLLSVVGCLLVPGVRRFSDPPGDLAGYSEEMSLAPDRP